MAPSEWIQLAEAAKRLGVHPATLRRWADGGEIPVMTTPGGHRRFALSDIERLAAARHIERAPEVNPAAAQWVEEVLVHAQTEIAHHHDEEWLRTLDDETRARSRDTGRELMGLLLQYVSHPEAQAEVEPEIREMGRRYAQQALFAGMNLPAALKATMFFREVLAESALQPPGRLSRHAEHNAHLLRRISRFINLVQLAVAETYDAHAVAALPRA